MSEGSQNPGDAEVAAMHDAVADVRKRVEQAKAAAGEATALAAGLQVTAGQSKEASAQALAALESIRASVTSAGESAARVEALRTQVEQVAQVAETRSAHIEDGRKYADAKRAELDVVLNGAKQAASEAIAHQAAGKATSDELAGILAGVQKLAASAQAHAEAVAATRTTVEGHATTTQGLAKKAAQIESQVREYEARLTELQEASARQQRTIDELLLGATNAGLASAFDKRSQSFKQPAKNWQYVFVASLGGLLLLAIIEAARVGEGVAWADLARMAVHRLPFLFPLVWLALHASRQASLAMRMEEEYGFKATVSTSFEGYRRQMAEIGADLAPDAPLARLCTDTLRTISKPPGNVYDKHRMDPTPVTAAADSMPQIMEGVSKTMGPGKS